MWNGYTIDEEEKGEKKIYICDASKKKRYSAIEGGSKSINLTCRKKAGNKGFLYERNKLVKKKDNVFIVENAESIGKMNKNEIVLISQDDESKEISDSMSCERGKCTLKKGKLIDPALSLLQFSRIHNFF